MGKVQEDRAGELLAAELAQRPLHHPWTARLHQLFLALSYLLVPPTRAHWDAADLGPRFRTARTLARALAAVRDTGSTTELVALQLPAHGIVQALLPVPWAAELATALTAAGRPEGRQLLATLGVTARPTVKRLVDTANPQLAAAARRLLTDLPPVPPHRLQLGVLGRFRLHRNGQPVDHRDGRRERVRQLLAYLVVYPTTTRAAVAGALWPDLDEEAAGRNLRVNLTHLQRLLEPDRADGEAPFFVRTSGTTLQLTGEGWLEVDVWQFDRLLDQAEQAERQSIPSRALAAYQQALPLYRGDYLADLPDADWADLERNRLRLRYQSVAIRAGELLLAGGDTTTPLTLAQAGLRVEPWSEAAYRLLVATHLARGDHAAARRALHHCQAMLTDLGAQPEPQTQMLLRRLNSATAPAPRKSVPMSLL